MIGLVAKARRERLGLNQDELAKYGGPGVATIGKFERGAQAGYALRTLHQIENALGWTRGVIDDFVSAEEVSDRHMEEWQHDLVEENIPDLSQPPSLPSELSPAVRRWLDLLLNVLDLVPEDRQRDAVSAAVLAIAQHLEAPDFAFVGRRSIELLRERGVTWEGGDGDADKQAGGPAAMTNYSDLYNDVAAYRGDEKPVQPTTD
jgi:transcriptional regulator with XRE-family HTH domain